MTEALLYMASRQFTWGGKGKSDADADKPADKDELPPIDAKGKAKKGGKAAPKKKK